MISESWRFFFRSVYWGRRRNIGDTGSWAWKHAKRSGGISTAVGDLNAVAGNDATGGYEQCWKRAEIGVLGSILRQSPRFESNELTSARLLIDIGSSTTKNRIVDPFHADPTSHVLPFSNFVIPVLYAYIHHPAIDFRVIRVCDRWIVRLKQS